MMQDKKSTERRRSRHSPDNFVFDQMIERQIGKYSQSKLRRTGKMLARKEGAEHSDGFARISDLLSMSESFKPVEMSSDLARQSLQASEDRAEEVLPPASRPSDWGNVRYSSIGDLSSIKKQNSRSPMRPSGVEILKMLHADNNGVHENSSSNGSIVNRTEAFIFQDQEAPRRQSDSVAWDKMSFYNDEQTKKANLNAQRNSKELDRKSQGGKKDSNGAIAAVELPSRVSIANPAVVQQPKSNVQSGLDFSRQQAAPSVRTCEEKPNNGPPTVNPRPRRIEPQMIRPFHTISEKDQNQSQVSSSALSKQHSRNEALIHKQTSVDVVQTEGTSSRGVLNTSNGHSAPVAMRSSKLIYQEIQQIVEREKEASFQAGKRKLSVDNSDHPRKQRMSDKENKQKIKRKKAEQEKRKQQKKKRRERQNKKASLIETRRQKNVVILPSELKRPEKCSSERLEDKLPQGIAQEHHESEEEHSRNSNGKLRSNENKREHENKEPNKKKEKPQKKKRSKTNSRVASPKKNGKAMPRAQALKEMKQAEHIKEVEDSARNVPAIIPLENLVDSQSCRSQYSQRIRMHPIKYWQGQRIEHNKGEIIGVSFTHPSSKKLKDIALTTIKSQSRQEASKLEDSLQVSQKKPGLSIEKILGIRTKHQLSEQLEPNVFRVELDKCDTMVLEGGKYKRLMIHVIEAKKNKVTIQFEDACHKIKDMFDVSVCENFQLNNRSGSHKALLELQVWF